MLITPGRALAIINHRYPLSRSTLYRWLAEDRVPVERIGGRLYLEHTEILKLLASNQPQLRSGSN